MSFSSRPAGAALVLLAACVPPPTGVPGDAGFAPKDQGVETGDAASLDADLALDAAPPDAAFPDAAPIIDDDRDGLPDDEDPNLGYANPSLFTDDFMDATQGWIFSSVSMEIAPADGVLRVSMLEALEREGWIGPRPSWSDYFVRTLLRVGAVGSSSDPESGYVAVIARASQVTPSRYVACGVDVKNQRVLLVEYEGTTRTTLGEGPSRAEPGWLIVNFEADGSFYRCRVGPDEVTGSSVVFSTGAIGFRSFDATFEADFIQVSELRL